MKRKIEVNPYNCHECGTLIKEKEEYFCDLCGKKESSLICRCSLGYVFELCEKCSEENDGLFKAASEAYEKLHEKLRKLWSNKYHNKEEIDK